VPLVLVVDDDPRIRHLLEGVLRTHAFNVITAEDGEGVLDLVRAHRPDAMILDLRMPRVPGMEVLRAMGSAAIDLPVLVLTGTGDEEHVLAAFEAGADDYVTKPFQPRVLVARLLAILRRGHSNTGDCVGAVALDPRTHTACIGEQQVSLSPTEYSLLQVLMRGAGRVFTSEDLLERVWGPAYAGQDEIVRANIYRLRHKLEPTPNRPRYILGRRGVGYFFAAD
jgi:DNA-binding response OmpR family regulator